MNNFNSLQNKKKNLIEDFSIKDNINTNSNYTEKLINYLSQEFLNLYQVNFDAKQTLLYGVPQGGKSLFTFVNASIQMSMNKSTIFIVRNYIKDAIHMIEKANRFSEYLKKNNFKSFDTVYAGDMSCKWVNNEVVSVSNSKEIEEALFSDNKKLVFVLANVYQLSAINYLLENRTDVYNNNLFIFIDEADALVYGLEHIPTNINLNKLLCCATQLFEITATPWDNLVGNDKLENQNIIVLQPPISYKGIRNIEFYELVHPISKFSNNLLEEDPNLIEFYNKLSEQEIFNKEYNVIIPHPIIVLHKTSTSTKHHNIFFNYFKKHYKNWIIIKEDSSGLFMFADILCGEQIKINNVIFEDKNLGIFNFKDTVIIPQLFQWMINNGGANKFSHIVIKSGRFSGRSRSYVSLDGNWHLTHQYYFGSTNVPSLIQEMRIVHDRPDAIPLKCYTPFEIGETIKKGAIMLEEQIDRLKKIRSEQNFQVQHFVKNGVWNSEKVPRKVKLTIGPLNKKFKINKTKKGKQDDGWDISIYREELNKTNINHIENVSINNNNNNDNNNNDNNNDNDNNESNDIIKQVKNEFTAIELLRKNIKLYIEQNPNINNWKTAREWQNITGLSGFNLSSSYHFAIMTSLVKEKFMLRKNNLLIYNNS